MSYSDTNCPCGGKKPTDTMLCDDCNTAYAEHPSMRVFRDKTNSTDSRRHAAIVLLSLSRKRKFQFARGQSVTTRNDQPGMPTRAGGDAVTAGVANSSNS